MLLGELNLFCPCCGDLFRVNTQPPYAVARYHSTEWGHLCCKECYDAMDMKYARMILGKSDPS